MAEITAAMVKQLRDKTGVGMMDCKGALTESGGDVQMAHEILRKKGLETARRKAGRSAQEGKVVVKMSANGRRGAILAVSCETDFVVKTEKFSELVDGFCNHLLANPAGGVEEFLALPLEEGTVDGKLKELIGLIGENMSVTAATTFDVDENGRIGSYIHHNGKLGVMISVTDPNMSRVDTEAVSALLNDLCMQVAFTDPVSLDKTGVPEDVIETERVIYREQMKDKPAEIIDKIIEGKLGKFFKQVCLVEQEFINPAKFKGSVRALMSNTSDSLAIQRYVRFELGTE